MLTYILTLLLLFLVLLSIFIRLLAITGKYLNDILKMKQSRKS